MCHVAHLVLRALVIPRVQGRVVSRLAVPFAVVVIGRDVQEVEVLGEFRDVVGDPDDPLVGCHGGGEAPPVLGEFFLEFLDKKDEILLVCRDSSSRGGVFPVQVEAVQLVLLDEPDRRVDKGPPAGGVGGHGGVLGRALRPPAHRHHHLQERVLRLQAHGALDGSFSDVISRINRFHGEGYLI